MPGPTSTCQASKLSKISENTSYDKFYIFCVYFKPGHVCCKCCNVTLKGTTPRSRAGRVHASTVTAIQSVHSVLFPLWFRLFFSDVLSKIFGRACLQPCLDWKNEATYKVEHMIGTHITAGERRRFTVGVF